MSIGNLFPGAPKPDNSILKLQRQQAAAAEQERKRIADEAAAEAALAEEERRRRASGIIGRRSLLGPGSAGRGLLQQ